MTDEKLEELNILSNSIKVRKKALASLKAAKKMNEPSVSVTITSAGGTFGEKFTISGELAEELISVIHAKVEEHLSFLEEKFIQE